MNKHPLFISKYAYGTMK